VAHGAFFRLFARAPGLLAQAPVAKAGQRCVKRIDPQQLRLSREKPA
jgi:hypothetical protein